MPPKFKRHLNDDEVTGSIRSERVRHRWREWWCLGFWLMAIIKKQGMEEAKRIQDGEKGAPDDLEMDRVSVL